MKEWITPAVEELDIELTEFDVLGEDPDGGVPGDGTNGSLGPKTSELS